jgi:fibronectin type 3 domain-containing protein
MSKKKIRWQLILALMVALICQSFTAPAYGAESFQLRTLSILSEIDLDWTEVEGATSYDIYRSPGSPAKIASVTRGKLWYRDYRVDMGKRYTYWVIAKNDNTQLATSNFCEEIAGGEEEPSAPSLRAKAFSSPYVELTWSGRRNALRYELERKDGDHDFHFIAQVKDETSYKDYWVTRGKTYTYRIRAFNDYGHSDYSKEVTISIKPEGVLPDIPASFSAKEDRVYRAHSDELVSNKRVLLSWRYDDNDANGFIVERKSAGKDYTQITKAIPGVNILTNKTKGSYTYDSTASTKQYYYYDNNISTDSTYYYRIKAYNKHGESDYTKEVRVTTMVTRVPSPPAQLTAEAIPGKVNLSWSRGSDNEEGFRIERRAEKDKSFSEIRSVSAGVSSYCDTGFSPNTVYYYRIRAYNDKGNSAYSKEVKVTTLSGPPSKAPQDSKVSPSENIYILLLYASPQATSVSRIRFLTVPPETKSGSTFLPVRDVANLFSAKVDWEDATQKVTLTYKDRTIEAWSQKNSALINGSAFAVDPNNPSITPIINEQKYMMFPLSLIETGFNCTVNWQPNNKFISVQARP